MTPFEYGSRAFSKGKPLAPALDAAFLATLTGQPDGTAAPALRQWQRGWIAASLQQPTGTDEGTRPCVNCQATADRIGEDTHGRPYWYCASCGTEFQTDPE